MKHILLVDDNLAMLESVGLALSFEGYLVTHATNALDAIKSLSLVAFQACITDLNLHGVMGGFTILDFIASKNINIPTILFTGFLPSDASLKAYPNVKVIGKPANVYTLLASI